MIVSFADEAAEKIYHGRVSRKLPKDIQNVVRRKLIYLDNADDLFDLRSPPSNRLELLKGNWAGQYSIRINDQWRICFFWEAGKASAVVIEDYH